MDIRVNKPIKNLPKQYSWYKRLGSQITYYVSQLPIGIRKNHLTKGDIKKIWNIIQPGDIILCGNFQHVSGVFISGIVTHAVGYLKKGRCIHAFAHGVSYIHLRRILRTYDTIVLLRPYWVNPEQKELYFKTLNNHLGKPYDFFFGLDVDIESYFCTKLINESLIDAGYKTGLESIGTSKNIIDTSLDTVYRAHRVLTPEQMIHGNFDIVYSSQNLEEINGAYKIRGGKISVIFPEINN